MPFDFLAAVTAPFRMQPGLRRVAAGGAPLTPNEIGSAHLGAKCEVLRHHGREALLALPDFDPTPVFETLAGAEIHGGPPALRRDGGKRLVAPRLRWSVGGDAVDGDGPAEIGAALRALPPGLRAAGLASLAFAEDFAVVDGASTRIAWLAVCLPSHWTPADKLGLPLATVHAPVADGATLIAASVSLARLVTAGERWERFVWTLTPRAALDAHPQRLGTAAWPVPAGPDAAAAAAFFRTEHQTFLPLRSPTSRQALFTIRIEVAPLAETVDSPERARRLLGALESMSDAVLDYRGLSGVRDPLCAWLGRRAA